VGIGAYLTLVFKSVPTLPLMLGVAVVLGLFNLREVKAAAGLQVVLVTVLLGILVWFIFRGMFEVQTVYFSGFFDEGFDVVFATAGMVFVSYLGVSKIASVSEEVKNPERVIPMAMFMALATAVLLYILGMVVMVGILAPDALSGEKRPVAVAAQQFLGPTGVYIIIVAALFAFISVANAAIMSGSRYPLAMSRDEIFPEWLGRLNRRGVPAYSVGLTVGCIILVLLVFGATKIAKLASAFQLLLFALNCLAVIIMRESKIDSYDPGFRVPLYPWLPIVGFLAPLLLISQMGFLPIAFSFLLVLVGVLYYLKKVRGRVHRVGAIFHIFERLGQRRFEGLDSE
ncbi:MAG: APC family permease, partial [Verrucomicrobiota bacterium]